MIKFNQIKSATIAATNESEVGRSYGISATVEVTDGTATHVREGRVTDLTEGKEMASFTGWNENSISVNMHAVEEDDQESVFAAIRLFIKNLKSEAASLNIASISVE